jgi:hypothetical protein
MRMCTRGSRFGRATVALVAGLVLLFSASPAWAAGPPRSGSGTGMLTAPPDVTVIRVAGGNSIEERTLTGIVEGSLTGTFEQRVTGTVHPNGRVTFRGVLVFTGTVQGCGDELHTVTLGLSGRGEVPEPGFPVTEANVRAIGPPSSTLHVTGQGTVTQVGAALTYDLRYVCH